MSDAQEPQERSRKRSRAWRAGLYLVPGYAVIRAAASMKETATGGMRTIADRHRELSERRVNPHSRTFNEAMALRAADALPLEAIERSCLQRKQVSMAVAFVSASFVIGSLGGRNLFGAFVGLLFVGLCCLFALKYEHRIWQIETGRAAPDEPLGGYRQFFARKGAIKRLFNPHLFG
ncbi:hypothetical protein C0Z18_21775 [Trinickia dabaoshanensis]|uniref:Uncharacterized protein n=1 Tax=Trinickia dabaoshanensis TaxID=564714 RepID=A0A2N7VIV9_9BURK|nr:hypothetical protein [Trinickia dabaoshanensis]PMS17085.1 hypothetical protein C0Z18_21775 [Trinickia dabaoshanensis]